MSQENERADFYGFLHRCELSATGIELRFYPYDFSEIPYEKCVFVVRFSDPNFLEMEVSSFFDEEVEVSVLIDRAEIHGIFSASEVVLKAKSIAVDWEAYSLEDYIERVGQIHAENKDLNQALTKAIHKNEKSLAIAHELLRRAEIKSMASEDLRRQQHSAIEVLKRLATHLESGD